MVLTFDDSVQSHRDYVAPLLKEYGFGATFFVTQRWMDDQKNFMTWQDIGEIHAMGFEIGNHSWTHRNFSTEEAAAAMEQELAQINAELAKVGVPQPVSFAWCGNAFGPACRDKLEELGYRFARRGMQPELPYGEIHVGPQYDPKKHDALLIPTTADAYPKWDLKHFKSILAQAQPGTYIVLQFHGVPDLAHPWVHTSPRKFRQYMDHLQQIDATVIALKDLTDHTPVPFLPEDPMRRVTYPEPRN